MSSRRALDETQRRTVQRLFEEVAELANDERSAYLDAHCDDAAVRAEVLAMVDIFDDGLGDFLDTPAVSRATLRNRGSRVVGPYRIGESIGEGGFGTVYLAEQTEPIRRRVALKVIKLGMDTKEIIRRFERERQALAIMDHPGIAKVYDAGATDDGRPYFVMEYVDGVAITEHCDVKRLDVAARLELFLDVCEAIQHAHHKGMVHRDVKPSNVLVVAQDDGRPQPKVIDFGIAKAMDPSLAEKSVHTLAGEILGTPSYMSPEQALGDPKDVDTRTDIYSLGVLLYELMTGVLPVDTKSLEARGARETVIQSKEPLKPSTQLRLLADEAAPLAEKRGVRPAALVRRLRGDLDWVTMKALEHDRSRRYTTASELAADIRRLLRDEPVLAGPPSRAHRLRKFVRRYRRGVAFTASLLVVFAAASVVSLVLWTRSEEARIEARGLYLSSLSDKYLESNPTTALLLALQAHDVSPGVEATSALAQAVGKQREQRALVGGRRLTDARFSPDGRHAATSHIGGEVIAWDIATGKTIARFRGHEFTAFTARYSPDGERLMTCSLDGSVRVWDPRSGEEVLRFFAIGVRDASFSPDGERIAVAGDRGLVAIHGARNGAILSQLGREALERRRVLSIVFDHDGRHLVMASGKSVQVWATTDERSLVHLDGPTGTVWDARFSNDGQLVLAASEDRTVRVWHWKSGEEVAVCHGHLEAVRSATFSHDDAVVVSASMDGSLRLWDARNGALITVLASGNGPLMNVHFDPTGERVITASRDGSARIWDARTSDELAVLGGHDGRIVRARYSLDGTRLVTASVDGTARVWVRATGRLQTVLRGHEGAVSDASLSPDNARVVTTSYDGTAKVWDAESGAMLSTSRRMTMLHGVAFSPTGNAFATAGDDGTARIWNLSPANGRMGAVVERHVFYGHAEIVLSAVFDPAAERLVTASYDGTARIWDVESGAEIDRLAHGDWVHAAEFSCDGTRVVTAARDATVSVWDLASGERIRVFRHGGSVTAVTLSSDDRRVASGARDSTARVWDIASGKELLRLSGRGAAVNWVSFAPGGEHLLWTTAHSAWVSLIEPLATAKKKKWREFTPAERDALGIGTPEERATLRYAWELARAYSSVGLDEGAPVTPESWEAHLLATERIVERGYLEESIERLRGLLRSRPASATAHGLLGRALREKKETAKAVSAFEAAVELRPGSARTWEHLARALAESGDALGEARAIREAARLAAKASALEVDRILTLAEEQFEAGKHAEAVRILEKLSGIDCGSRADVLADRLTQYRGRVAPELVSCDSIDSLLETDGWGERMRSFSSLPPEKGRRGHREILREYLEGRRLEADGNLPGAVSHFESAIRLGAREETLFLRLVKVLRDRGEAETAASQLTGAIGSGALLSRFALDAWLELALTAAETTASGVLDGWPRGPQGFIVGGDEEKFRDARWVLERLRDEGAIRLNCGWLEDYESPLSRTWYADRFFTGGARAALDVAPTHVFRHEIKGSREPFLYKTERWFPSQAKPIGGYRIPLPRGKYRVTLHFSEAYHKKLGGRRFDVLLEGQPFLQNYEPLANGFGVADAKTTAVDVTDGALNLDFGLSRGDPILSAIEVAQAEAQ